MVTPLSQQYTYVSRLVQIQLWAKGFGCKVCCTADYELCCMNTVIHGFGWQDQTSLSYLRMTGIMYAWYLTRTSTYHICVYVLWYTIPHIQVNISYLYLMSYAQFCTALVLQGGNEKINENGWPASAACVCRAYCCAAVVVCLRATATQALHVAGAVLLACRRRCQLLLLLQPSLTVLLWRSFELPSNIYFYTWRQTLTVWWSNCNRYAREIFVFTAHSSWEVIMLYRPKIKWQHLCKYLDFEACRHALGKTL